MLRYPHTVTAEKLVAAENLVVFLKKNLFKTKRNNEKC